MQEANQARINRVLDQRFRLGDTVYSWRNLAASGLIVRKYSKTRTHSQKKRNLSYATLVQPITEYRLELRGGAIIDCPKIVYDWLPQGNER